MLFIYDRLYETIKLKSKLQGECIRVRMNVNWLSWCVPYTAVWHTRMFPIKWLAWDTIALKKQYIPMNVRCVATLYDTVHTHVHTNLPVTCDYVYIYVCIYLNVHYIVK